MPQHTPPSVLLARQNPMPTIGGVMAAVGSALMGAHVAGTEMPQWLIITALVLNAAGTALMGMTARQSNRTSEDVGARRFR